MTTTNTSEYTEEEKRRLHERWDNRLESAQHRALKRLRRAAKAEEDTTMRAAIRTRLASHLTVFFHAKHGESVTELAPLVAECLDDVRARAKRGGWRPLAPQNEFLPKGVLASAALAQYLERWKLLDA
jgi:hypothetical protein